MSISSLALGLYLILVGCVHLFSLNVPSLLLGICALVAGILVLVGDRFWPTKA